MHEGCQKNNGKSQRCTNVSHIFAVNASHIRAYLSRRRIRGRKASRSGARAASVSTLQKRCITGTQRLSSSVMILRMNSVSTQAAITTLGDKRWAPVTQRPCSVDTEAAPTSDRDAFLPRIRPRATGKQGCGSRLPRKCAKH